ncbi:MAG: 16S rRNA (uracil1498-N3)-methyltransferase [Flavobacteriales bacterium]|jgi:16S rRNA (uracil1498-N3)-methyltransferase
MQLFYSAEIGIDNPTYTFSREESKHIIRVLRKKEEDVVHITDGRGYLYTCTIISANPNKCTVQITDSLFHEPMPYKLHMAVAPTKNNDRFEWFLEKATEIGITEITPLLCDHSERKNIKEERLSKIVQSAMKQSLQMHLPKLHPLTTYASFISQLEEKTATKYIAHCEDGVKISLQQSLSLHNEVVILIGPEGDFSEKEILIALENKYIALTLGKNRLRTETAALTACQLLSFLNEQ